ncbi:TolC family protein [Hyphomicrobiales bacterium]|nr:TolC family protein [Hyphomicrobiales bacterium]
MTIPVKISIFVLLLLLNTNSYSKTIEFEKYNSKSNIQNNDQYVDFIKDAVISQPEYKEIIAKKTKFNFDYRVSKGERFPTISSSIVNDHYFDRKINEIDSIRKIQDDSLDAHIQLDQSIYSGNRITNNILNAKRQTEIGNLNLQERASNLIMDANLIYFDAFKFQTILNVIEQKILEVDKLLKISNQRVKAGITQPAEEALMQIKLNELLIIKAKMSFEIVRSRETFKRFFGEDFTSVSIPNLKLDNLSANNSLIRQSEKLLSYEVQAARITTSQAETEIDIAKGEYRPQFGLNVKYIQYDFDRDFDEYDIRGGIYFNMPLFDFGRRGNKVNSARANYKQHEWGARAEEKDFLIKKVSLEGQLVALVSTLEELKSTKKSTERQKNILSNRMSGREYNSIALADVIIQDLSLYKQILESEIELYLTDLSLSHAKTVLLQRFRLSL